MDNRRKDDQGFIATLAQNTPIWGEGHSLKNPLKATTIRSFKRNPSPFLDKRLAKSCQQHTEDIRLDERLV